MYAVSISHLFCLLSIWPWGTVIQHKPPTSLLYVSNSMLPPDCKYISIKPCYLCRQPCLNESQQSVWINPNKVLAPRAQGRAFATSGVHVDSHTFAHGAAWNGRCCGTWRGRRALGGFGRTRESACHTSGPCHLSRCGCVPRSLCWPQVPAWSPTVAHHQQQQVAVARWCYCNMCNIRSIFAIFGWNTCNIRSK
jgi:hypothetical protein